MKRRLTVILFLLIVLLGSCSIERHYQNERSENGNNLTFVYLKKTTRTFSSWYGYYPENKIDSLNFLYSGGQTEISNKAYWTFLNYLKEIDSTELFERHRPKTNNWLNFVDDFNFADSMAQHYDNIASFGDYPVVNITPKDALAYVNWLTAIEPDSTVIYTLFTADDWQLFFNENNDIDSNFSWESDYWRNSSNDPLGNFAEFDQNQIRYNQLTDKISWYGSDSLGFSAIVNGPMPCWSFHPNSWGAYNMSGNVAEMTTSTFEIDGKWYAKTRGGSWHSPIFYLREVGEESYQLPSPYVGFRVVKIQFKAFEK